MTTDVETALRSHPFFRGFPEEDLERVEQIGKRVEYQPGEVITKTDAPAERFILLLEGEVTIEVESQESDDIPVQKLTGGDVMGWSWLIPPHDWEFDARARGSVQAIEIDGNRLRSLCDENPDLANRIKSGLIEILAERVSSIRYQLLDIHQQTDEFQALTGG